MYLDNNLIQRPNAFLLDLPAVYASILYTLVGRDRYLPSCIQPRLVSKYSPTTPRAPSLHRVLDCKCSYSRLPPTNL